MAAQIRWVSKLALVVVCCSFDAIPAVAQRGAVDSKAILTATGRVESIFEGEGTRLVMLLVQGAEISSLNDVASGVRFPAPGEYIYVHVDQEGRARGRFGRKNNPLPAIGTNVRAKLGLGERNRWQALQPGWFEPVGDREFAGGTNRVADLGLTTEQVSTGFTRALRVVSVVPNSPAGEAGIEKGDVLVKANEVALTGPDKLEAEYQRSQGVLVLTVRDVRTGRDIPVKIGSGRAASQGRSVTRPSSRSRPLGVTTALAFFGGDAVVKITEVKPNSAAEDAGLKPGLLILKANGKVIDSPDRMKETEQSSRGSIELTVMDPKDRKERLVNVDLR